MTFEKLDSTKFKSLDSSQLQCISGGEPTAAGRKHIGDYFHQVPQGREVGGKIVVDWVTVYEGKYRVWDADDSTCNCFLNERFEWGSPILKP